MTMIDRQKKKFIVLVIGLLLYLASAARSHQFSFTSHQFRNRKHLTMTRKPCQDAQGNKGVCVFKWDCLSQEGVSLTTCVDGFLFGSCCKLKVDAEIFPSNEPQSENKIDITTRDDETETTEDTHKKPFADPTWKPSNFEPYYSGVTYSFDVDAEGQQASDDVYSGVPLIYTLADNMQQGQTLERGESFTEPHEHAASNTTEIEVAQSTDGHRFPVTDPQSSFTNELTYEHKSSSETDTFSYNDINLSSLSEVTPPAIRPAAIPLVYTLTSQMPSVYNQSTKTNSTELSNFYSNQEELNSPVTLSSSGVTSSPAEISEMMKGTNNTSTTLAAGITKLYAFGTSNAVTESGVTDFFHTLEMDETDPIIHNRNNENHLHSTISTFEDTTGTDQTNFSQSEEIKETTGSEHFTEVETMIYTETDNVTDVNELTTELGKSFTESFIDVKELSAETTYDYRETLQETSHNDTPFYSSGKPSLDNSTYSDYYSILQTETYFSPSTEVESENSDFGNTSSVSQLGNSQTTSKMANISTTTSRASVLFDSEDNYSTLTFEDVSTPKTTTMGKLSQTESTYLTEDATSTIFENLSTFVNEIENLADEYPESYMNEDEIVSMVEHSQSETPVNSEYNNAPEYDDNATDLPLTFLSGVHNSSLNTTQEPTFDSTWFFIKLSEFFWDNFTFNESYNLHLADESHEITTLPNYSDTDTTMQHVTHPPEVTQMSPNNTLNTSSENFQSSITSDIFGYHTDFSDSDETIYQNLLSIMEFNDKSTTPFDHSQNNVVRNNTFGDDEESEQIFQESAISDHSTTNLKEEVTKTSKDGTYDNSLDSNNVSTIADSSQIHEDTKLEDFINRDSLATEPTFSTSNSTYKNIQIINEEIDTKSYTSAMNLDNINYTNEEYLVNKPEKASSFDAEDVIFSGTSNQGMDSSPTTEVFLSETKAPIITNATETDLNLILSPDPQESILPETSISVTMEFTSENTLSSSTSQISIFPGTYEESIEELSLNSIAQVSTDHVTFINHTMFQTMQEEMTTQDSLNFTSDVSTDFDSSTSAITFTSKEDSASATHIDTTLANAVSSIVQENITTNNKMTTSEMETTVKPETSSETVTLVTTSEGDTTTKPIASVTKTTTEPTRTASEETPTTLMPTSETVQMTKPTTISVAPSSTSPDPTYTTQKYGISQEISSPPKLDYRKNCGVRTLRPTGRIVGGTDTFYGKWPWQALVKEATWWGLFVKNKCGGVLINSRFVITAAHCQPGFLGTLIVILGAHDLTGAEDYLVPVARNVKRMVLHRHYNAQTFENDLAILELESAVEFLPHVVPICLPHRYEDFTGKMAFVTGWGKLTHGGDVPNILQEVQVPIVTNRECQKMYLSAGHEKLIRSHFVCAGYSRGGQDSCEGDSGGPLMVQREDSRWVLVGTVSHGIGCADPNLPGVYMRMSAYRPWIDSIIRTRKVVRQKQGNSTSVITKKTRRSRTIILYA